jgi:plastocyanin
LPRTLALILAAAALALALALPATAGAEVKTQTFRMGPITVGPYQVATNYNTANQLISQIGTVPHPDEDGFITGMRVDLVDRDGSLVPIRRLMLHHIVFQNIGPNLFSVKNAACDNFQMFDSKTTVPALFDPFFGRGEEGHQLVMPPGYGYPMKRDDKWGMAWMFMNHRNKTDRAYIRYRVTYDTSKDITPAKPVWMDVEGCRADPVFTVPGGGRPGSTYSKSSTWTPPGPGRIIAGGGHVHGGAKNLVLSQPACGDRTVAKSEPTWGMRSHPFYNVKPVLHEPGPINMSGFLSQKGIPVAGGQPVKLTARYDAELTHARVMGIFVVYYVPDASVRDGCGALPDDLRYFKTSTPGRAKAPRFTVPLTGLDGRGVARAISRPPGRTRRLGDGATIRAGNYFFSRPNVSVARGSTLNWRFTGTNLHNITVANGVRGFHSDNLNEDRTFSKRLGVRGTYRLFCALHPVAMKQTITVR